jgi:cyclic pyranopterin phosphate synthase
MVQDQRGRSLRDLRVSVTDRCSFRCRYCMPRERFGADHVFLGRDELLSVTETVRLVRLFVDLGVTKVRLTGGEPLLRPDLEQIVEQVAALPGVTDLALTTNGAALASRAATLQAAGLNRVTVSLDTLDPVRFTAMSDTRVPLQQVLDGIAAAAAHGLGPVKLNAVLQRGLNDEDLEGLAEFARAGGHVLRVIEFMDVGTTNHWDRQQVVPSSEVLARLDALHPLEPVRESRGSNVAERYRYVDGGGEVGLVSSVTRPFCGDCVRARITAHGHLHTCLFSPVGLDLAAPLRAGATDDELRALISSRWASRDDAYSEQRGLVPITARPEMSHLGG